MEVDNEIRHLCTGFLKMMMILAEGNMCLMNVDGMTRGSEQPSFPSNTLHCVFSTRYDGETSPDNTHTQLLSSL